MNVFVGCARVELGCFRGTTEFVESRHQLRPLRRRQDPDAFERPRESLRALNIRVNQPPVEIERSGEALENFRRPFLESPAPEFHFRLAFLALFLWEFFKSARTCIGNPIRLINPRASFWSYSAPMVKLAISSE